MIDSDFADVWRRLRGLPPEQQNSFEAFLDEISSISPGTARKVLSDMRQLDDEEFTALAEMSDQDKARTLARLHEPEQEEEEPSLLNLWEESEGPRREISVPWIPLAPQEEPRRVQRGRTEGQRQPQDEEEGQQEPQAEEEEGHA